MKRTLATILMLTATVAQAGPRNVLVLRSEGSADTASRTSIDSHVLRIARHLEGKIDAGDITLTDAAAAAGCNAADAACKDEILMTFAVDEIVSTTVTSAGNGQMNVTVRRLTKGTAPRTAQSTIPSGKPPDAKLDNDLGPLFGLASTAQPVEKTPEKTPEKAVDKPPTQPAQPTEVTTTPVLADATPPPAATSEPAAPMQPEPPMVPEGRAPDRTLQKVGMGVGGGLALLGLIMWSAASSKQKEINDAPVNTPEDFVHLQQLEKDADGLAGGGNLFFLGGVVLAGVSAYLYVRKGRQARSAQTAIITPTVFPHGAGMVLTFGGSR